MLTYSVYLKKCTHVKKYPEKFYTEKKTKHTLPNYSIFASCLFDPTKNKFDCYKGEDCMEKFCKDLREHAMKMINYVKRK